MVAKTKAMPETRMENTTDVVIWGVTLETIQDELRKAGIKPGQRVRISVQKDPWDEFFALADRVSERTKKLGLTDEELERLIEE